MDDAWDPEFAARSPAFAPLLDSARALRGGAFPDGEDFNRLIAARGAPVVNACGQPLRFVAQGARGRAFADGYEPRIYLRGEVQFRRGSWHDAFNALVWLAFPRTKAALNERQFHELDAQRMTGASDRGPAQDALTLFDESGVIVATSEPALYAALADHAWKELFWRRRDEVVARMRFFLFGHSLYEKMLRPFAGVTGRGMLCEVTPGFFGLPADRQLAHLDAQVAARFAAREGIPAAREFAPVPLLGIPGWCADNRREAYYDDTRYFRLPRRAGGAPDFPREGA